jgi:heme-degrading monooxygenase HmoA
MSKQITVVNIIHFKGIKSKYHALKSMALLPEALADETKGLEFYKLMGSGGGNGFSVWPNFSKYTFMSVWSSQEHAEQFFKHNSDWKAYIRNSFQIESFFLKNIVSHGTWGGKNPFISASVYEPDNAIAVLTRATIRWQDMFRFWIHVPAVSKQTRKNSSPILALGIGEMPFRYQATFSVWKTGKEMVEYAYKNEEHKKMIQKTRKTGWYSEELFARFDVLEASNCIALNT